MGVGVRGHLVVGEDILEDDHICVLATSLELMILFQVIKYIYSLNGILQKLDSIGNDF